MSIEIGISKFRNMNGVTCYMNSILSILQQTPIFCDWIISNDFKKYIKDDDFDNKISYQLHKLFRISMSMNNFNLTPSSLRKVCSDKDFVWGENQQQDSAEFLQFLLTKIEEEFGQNVLFIPGLEIHSVKSIKDSIEVIKSKIDYQNFLKKEFSPMKKIFTGLEQVNTQCYLCGNKKNNFQTFSFWELPIPVDKNINKEFELEDCLNKWSEKEKLDDNNRIYCDFCGVKTNVDKSSKVFSAPKILIIQFKRFQKNLYGSVVKKIDNKINFPIENLDISKYISDSSCYKDKCKYNLIAVNCHQGNPNLGHYYSIVKNRYDDNWYVFNDDSKPLRLSNKDEIIDPRSYILFYFRIN